MIGIKADEEADRTKRVKEARDEAKKEIDAYRKEKEDEFKKFEAEVRHALENASTIIGKNKRSDIFDIAHKR